MTAIPETATRRDLSAVLEDAGWSVHHASGPDDALRLCRSVEADVLLLHDSVEGGPIAFLDRLTADGELFNIAVVVVGGGLGVDGVVSAMNRGAADVLRTPLDPADTVARAAAAARTKALVKELTRQNQRLEGQLLFDDLTGLRNRRAILHDVETMIATALRHGRALSVIMADIDRFKSINDVHGHAVGDDVLREVARRLSERLRGADVAGRLGGDEIIVVLPETDAEGADTLARSIRDAVAAGPVGDVPVTLSLGSVEWRGEPVDALLERADQALYAAKHAGRDRAVAG